MIWIKLVNTDAPIEYHVKLLDGAWFTAFRNVRHGHVLVYPLILLLTGYLVELRRKHPKVCDGAIGGFPRPGSARSRVSAIRPCSRRVLTRKPDFAKTASIG